MRLSSAWARSIWCWISAHCGRSSSTTAPARRRLARRVMAVTICRSRNSSPTEEEGGTVSRSRCVFRNNRGSASRRCRIAGDAFRQAPYHCPASRLVKRCAAKASARRGQSSGLERATGTKHRMATCAGMAPLRTCCCTLSGSSSTNANRRATQLGLRSKRPANSSKPYPKWRSSSASNQPSSSAVSRSLQRRERSSTSASASVVGHTTASTVSRPNCCRALMRW